MGLFSEDAEDAVSVTATFPESNPFGLVVNGEQNGLLIHLDNSGHKNYTLMSAQASFHNVEDHWSLVKNASALRYNVPLMAGSNFSAPFQVYSEFRPQEMGLTVWVNLADQADKSITTLTAMNQTISVVEAPSSWMDPQLLFLFFVIGTALLGGAYAAYSAFLGPTTKKKGGAVRRKGAVPAKDPLGAPGVGTGGKAFEEEWIPAHHLKTTKTKSSKGRKRDGAGTTSGGEELTSAGEVTSGAESGPEGKIRKRRGKKA